MKMNFLGATGTVTGSRTAVEHADRRLLVDCGLFQGLKQLRLRNWAVPPTGVDAVVLTHAHLDHSGFVPRLVAQGFGGAVHCTPATAELCGLLWPDAGRLAEEDADQANRHGWSKHHPALPLFTEEDARVALRRLVRHEMHEEFEPLPGFRIRFSGAGHILGAASVHVRCGNRSVLFSGDLGRDDDLVLRPPEPPPAADAVVIESTYGDRVHQKVDVQAALAAVINRTAARGGIVLIPSFAVGRAQTVLYLVHLLKQARRIPELPVFLNSPMAADATRIYARHRPEHRLDEQQCAAMGQAAKIVNTVEESKRLNSLRFPSIIVSASGMATGGRVLHHLEAFAPDERNCILFVGFQAAGTRGASLVGGAREVKMHGRYVPVRAEVAHLDALSAHADRDGLIAWLAKLPAPPRHVFVNHGEPVAADALRLAIEERLRWPTVVPDYRDAFALD
jgi:metallo-beta-lactamase family protein